MTLTPTSYVVLGCLALGGPATAYRIEQAVAPSIGRFWSFPHSQLYSEPARLVQLGLLAQTQEDGGRRRRTYAITDAGRAALAAWVATPTDELPEVRDVAMLKLSFGAVVDADDRQRLAAAQVAAHRDRLAEYAGVAEQQVPPPAALPLEFGMAFHASAAQFWASLAEGAQS